MKYTGPKVKLSRALGIPLTPKAMKYMTRKPYPPGQHGLRKRHKKLSEYGKQLLEKQRLKFQYNLSERQLRNYYRKANQAKGNTAENLVRTLESRLDTMVLRAGFAPTIFAARQVVNHGHVTVNDVKTTAPSFLVSEGDKVTLREKSREIPMIQEAMNNAAPPPYVALKKEEFTVEMMRACEREEVPIMCEMPLVIEFYSR
jgi:small subunit ribosomal protein S4